MAVGQPREEVAPRQRARVGVGDVDLELRDDDEQRRRRDRPAVLREDVLVGGEVHLVGIDRAFRRHRMADREVGQQRAAQHLQHTQHDPARAAGQQRRPPAQPVRGGLARHEAQVVGLLAHLRDQRHADGQRRTEGVRVEGRGSRLRPNLGRDAVECTRMKPPNPGEGQHQQRQPQRLRPQLQPADGGDAVGDQRDHGQRAQQVAPLRRDVQRQFQRVGHHRRLQREEDEGEARVDQRGQRRADVAEAGAPRQQVHVDAVPRRVDADRQAGQEDDQAGGQDGQRRVGPAVLQQQRRADRLQDQEGRRAEGGVGHAPAGPAPEALRRVAQRVVLQRLAGDPGVVVPPQLDDVLRGVLGGGRRVHGAWQGGKCTNRARTGMGLASGGPASKNGASPPTR